MLLNFFVTSILLATELGLALSFVHSAVLDDEGKFHLSWVFDNDTITFMVEVETLGYVGLGLSGTGSMAFADIVIGGVESQQPYLQNFFSMLIAEHNQVKERQRNILLGT
nr:PREDICTED: DBH-like monooxygenase protein 1 homolog [Latimeria chalumnae]|eukprot:XP_006014200.1 PREDICTED: DBH-like monooxygenase protein 1 homolog [Latimeria chalumnae]